MTINKELELKRLEALKRTITENLNDLEALYKLTHPNASKAWRVQVTKELEKIEKEIRDLLGV